MQVGYPREIAFGAGGEQPCAPKMYMSVSTSGAHLAPIARPWRTLTACGIILRMRVRLRK